MSSKAMAFVNTHYIANTGATSIFVMAGIPMSNIHQATDTLSINLSNRDVMCSTHVCNIVIQGTPDDPHRAYCPRIVHGFSNGHTCPMQGGLQGYFYQH